MTSFAEHAMAVFDLVRDEPVRSDDRPDFGGKLQRLCRAATKDLPAAGVGLSLLSVDGDVLTVAASGRTSAVVEELQFTLGEGPCLQAFATRRPVLIPDLGAPASQTWPGYAPAAYEHGVRAVFAFPLQIGDARLGALDVYRDYVGPLSPWSATRALSYADAAMQTMLDAQDNSEEPATLPEAADMGFEVYQAQGMVKVQLGVTAEQALVRMRAYAYLHDRRLRDVAKDVIARRLMWEPEDSTDGPAE